MLTSTPEDMRMKDLYILAEFLRHARYALRKSVVQIAKETGVSSGTVDGWEDLCGVPRTPKEDKYEGIVKAYNLERDEFIRINNLAIEAKKQEQAARLPIRRRRASSVFR